MRLGRPWLSAVPCVALFRARCASRRNLGLEPAPHIMVWRG